MTEGRQAGRESSDGATEIALGRVVRPSGALPAGPVSRGRATAAGDRAPQLPVLRPRRPGRDGRGVRYPLPPAAGARGRTPRAPPPGLPYPARRRGAPREIRDGPAPPSHALALEPGDARGGGGVR